MLGLERNRGIPEPSRDRSQWGKPHIPPGSTRNQAQKWKKAIQGAGGFPSLHQKIPFSSGVSLLWPCPRQGFAAELQPEWSLGLKSKGIKGSSSWVPFPGIPALKEPVMPLCPPTWGSNGDFSKCSSLVPFLGRRSILNL